ncbi:alpha/beta hydrolase-like protein [Gordonia terrae C-6]|uniref:Alpha/beta hydrolase-like protein n=1 Tax=Gordonia terrae C-6 TaxID=1316928 RepID=R7YEA3_9ACTN|nr:alpha/beta hydrolase-like protein [Gordonia terrae]EON34346.1 alpha/beta hydrolase-like protein [Gordonia terrae C-6]
MPGTDGLLRPPPTALVVIPGTGSDADHVTRAFGGTAADLGIELIALEPTTSLIDGHLRGLDRAARAHRSIVVGGVSIGAAIALDWALRDGGRRCAGVLAALPAWSGDARTAPAAASAVATAEALERDGLETTIAAMAGSSPDWLATELSRSWRRLHPGLVAMLREAAGYRAPVGAEIAGLAVPLAIVAAADDPVHPITVAREWHAAAPRSALVEVGLDDWGRDPGLLGAAARDGLIRLTDPEG